jgi:hypothetical protein
METLKRLSLEDFKSKAVIINEQSPLDTISGGILGACHCYQIEETHTNSDGWFTLVTRYVFNICN